MRRERVKARGSAALGGNKRESGHIALRRFTTDDTGTMSTCFPAVLDFSVMVYVFFATGRFDNEPPLLLGNIL